MYLVTFDFSDSEFCSIVKVSDLAYQGLTLQTLTDSASSVQY